MHNGGFPPIKPAIKKLASFTNTWKKWQVISAFQIWPQTVLPFQMTGRLVLPLSTSPVSNAWTRRAQPGGGQLLPPSQRPPPGDLRLLAPQAKKEAASQDTCCFLAPSEGLARPLGWSSLLLPEHLCVQPSLPRLRKWLQGTAHIHVSCVFRNLAQFGLYTGTSQQMTNGRRAASSDRLEAWEEVACALPRGHGQLPSACAGHQAVTATGNQPAGDKGCNRKWPSRLKTKPLKARNLCFTHPRMNDEPPVTSHYCRLPQPEDNRQTSLTTSRKPQKITMGFFLIIIFIFVYCHSKP